MICPYTGLKCNWFCEICSIAEEQSEYYPMDKLVDECFKPNNDDIDLSQDW